MRSGSARKEERKERPWRLLLWAALASVVCWFLQIGYPLETTLRPIRNNAHLSQASGDIILVGIDDKSLAKVGKWPWPRGVHAKLIDEATRQGAKAIYVDLVYDSPGKASEDAALEQSLRRSGLVTLAHRGDIGIEGHQIEPTQVLGRFARWTKPATIGVDYDWKQAVWNLPFADRSNARETPSFAAAMSRRAQIGKQGSFRIDYSIDPTTVPYVSAATLLEGGPHVSLAGKTIIVGANDEQLGDQFWLPGYGRMAGAYVHILGAETLRNGMPTYAGWFMPLLIALALCLFTMRQQRAAHRAITLGVAFAAFLIGPIVFEAQGIFFDVVPALVALTFVSVALARRSWRNRGRINEDTGLPNLAAFRSLKASGKAIAVARLHNLTQLRAALTESEQSEANRQLVARLNASGDTKLFQGEDGTFAWLVDPGPTIGNHLEALHAMFRSPLSVGGRQIDVALSFGVELASARSITNRLGSAVLAADEAWVEGLRWKLHDPSRQEEVNWRVSLLGELDTAIDHGEVWLAYQPQLDIRTGRIVGAEALARWTHPQKGPISPSEFVAAAENNGRIGKLTDFVLDRAIGAAAAINRRGTPFQVAVNLSARLLADRELLSRISSMLRAHDLKPNHLTLELTETASLQDADSGLSTLDGLRQIGVRVAIDDYGTGLSTLDYLKKIPANEIKIDQSFVKSMRVNRSDLIMVQSTIALAHSLGRTVVAEGVEDQQSLEELGRMGCDVAQGFAIGRPMGVRELVQRLQIRAKRHVA